MRTIRLWLLKKVLSIAVLLFFAGTLLYGTIATFMTISYAQESHQKQLALTAALVHMHLKHIYSEYWTCNLVAFLSQEQIVCSVLDEQLQPGFNRYAPYASIVAQDPNAAYVLPVGSAQAVAFAKLMAQTGKQYQVILVHNYIVYRPVWNSKPSARVAAQCGKMSGYRRGKQLAACASCKPISV